MTWHVVCRAGPDDQFALQLVSGDHLVEVPFDNPDHPHAFQSTIPKLLADYHLQPSAAAMDLLRAAIGAYVADVRVPRKTAFDRWTRDICLHVPVQAIDDWEGGAATLEQLLSFLTGDRWKLVVRPAPANYQPLRISHSRRRRRAQPAPPDVAVVSLFSGGLDSFIGAIDQLEVHGKVVLVGHHRAGDPAASASQNRALTAIRTSYSEDQAPLLQVWLSPPVASSGYSEITMRARSILFMTLGVFFANGIGARQAVVPENGWIALNVPLTPARMGSFSTRTTHPYLIALMRELLHQLGLDIDLQVPYRFHTKGEMVAGCANHDVLMAGLTGTMSCAHPGAGRFSEARTANQHCGRCLPCLVRRAAISASRSDPTPYLWTNAAMPLTATTGADLMAVKIALDHFARRPPQLTDVLQSGPLPGMDDDLAAYVDVFRRGLIEMRAFLAGVGALET